MTVDDFLGLSGASDAGLRWRAFGGPSGSGKSTLSRWMLQTHRDWRGPVVEVTGRPLDWSGLQAAPVGCVVRVDEVLRVDELARVAGLLARGHRVLVATHLPAVAFWPLSWRWRGEWRSTRVDGVGKIARELDRRGITYSPAAVQAYVRQFGPVYTELDIVFERAPGHDFDQALARFLRYHRVTVRRAGALERLQ